MNEANLHEGLLALIAAAITASVFTIGFSSARHHNSLRQLRQAERDGKPYAEGFLEDEAGELVFWGNLLLWALVVAATAVAGFVGDASIGSEEVLTLLGLVAVETVIVVLGWLDHRHVKERAKSAHDKAVAGAKGDSTRRGA